MIRRRQLIEDPGFEAKVFDMNVDLQVQALTKSGEIQEWRLPLLHLVFYVAYITLIHILLPIPTIGRVLTRWTTILCFRLQVT